MDVPKKKKVWHTQQEEILKIWGEASACYRYMNYQAYLSYKKMSFRFTLPIIVISTVTGTANFAQGTFPTVAQPYVPSVIGAFNLFAAIITTIMQFLKVNELMECHRVSSVQYGKLSRTITLELALPLYERSMDGSDMVEQCRAEFDRLIEQSPSIPGYIIRQFENEFPGETGFAKPEIMNIQPISAYRVIDEIMETKAEKKIPVSEKLRNELTMIRDKGVVTVTRQNLMDEINALRSVEVVKE